jgi:predicted transcriptional regulator
LYKSDKQNAITTELQKKILKHICKTRNADYKTISKETGRDRITILQSLQPLMKRQYVYKQKIDPDRIKSKLIFKPTDKGMAYSIAILGVDIDDVRKAHLDADVLVEYNELIKKIDNPLQRKQFEREMIKVLVLYNLFDDKGKTIITNRKGFLKQGIRIGIFNLTADKYYDPENLFTPQVVERLKGIVGTSELKEFKEFLMKIRKNLDLSIKQLSA